MLALEGSREAGAGVGRGELKWDEPDSNILDDVEEELILKLGLCSSLFLFLLLVSDPTESVICRVGVFSLLELSEFPH